MMKLFAASDLHLDQEENYHALLEVKRTPEDVLVLAGDICETESQLENVLSHLKKCYQHILWTPGNHELWIRPSLRKAGMCSEQRYRNLIEVCRKHQVLTPEDPFLILKDDENRRYCLALTFSLYDYSFRPKGTSKEQAYSLAEEAGIICMDEALFNLAEYENTEAWCEARIQYSEKRLAEIPKTDAVILINHYPLKRKSFHLEKIPQFSLWCGSVKTESWPEQHKAVAVINGHLHMPGQQWIDSIPFYDVSVGYPKQWDSTKRIDASFTEIFAGQSFKIA